MLVDVQTISIVLAAIGVFIAAVNSIVSSRRAERTREAQLFMQIYNRWTARDFSKTYVNYRYHYDIKDHIFDENQTSYKHPSTFPLDIHTDWQMLAAYFEGIGVLVKEHLIDINLVENLARARASIALAIENTKLARAFIRFEAVTDYIMSKLASCNVQDVKSRAHPPSDML